jgi:hypothetical protein
MDVGKDVTTQVTDAREPTLGGEQDDYVSSRQPSRRVEKTKEEYKRI